MARGTSVRRWLQPMGFATIVVGGLASFLAGHTVVPAMAMNLFAIALFVAGSRWLRAWEGSVSATSEGLFVDGTLVVRASSIKRAFVSAEAGKFVVHLRSTFGRVYERVEVDTEEEARAILARLGVDGSVRTTAHIVNWGTPKRQWQIAAGVGLMSFAMVFAMVISVQHLSILVPLLILAAFVVASAAIITRGIARMTVGADGVHVRRGLARARFVPYSEIRSTKIENGMIIIERTSGESMTVFIGAGAKRADTLFSTQATAQMQTLVEQIEIGRGRTGANLPAQALLERAGRDARAWVRALRGKGDDQAGFRDAALSVETLWRIAEDPSASASARAGAAVALRSRIDDDGLSRLRIAAETCASPKLRVALAAATEEDDSDLEAAMDDLDDRAHLSAVDRMAK